MTAAARAALEHAALAVEVGARVGSIPHTITRFRIALDAFEARPMTPTRARRSESVVFVRPRELDTLAMPAPHRRLARLVLARAEEQRQ